jgi:GT2 family glycosyltransferase
MTKRVAIILVNWNGYTHTANCIDSLLNISYPHFQTIVVDNGSTDHSIPLLKKHYPNIKIIELGHNHGFTGGNNAAIRYAIDEGFEYTLLLNNDTYVTPSFLSELVTFIDQHPHVGAIQPKILFAHDHTLIWNTGSKFNSWLGYTSVPEYQKKDHNNHSVAETEWITGCALLMRTSLFKKIGLLSDNMFLYYEDVDLSFRIKQTGHSLFIIPQSVIYHVAGVSGLNNEKSDKPSLKPIIHYYNVRNRIWILKKYVAWFKLPTVVIYNTFYIAALLLYFVLKGNPLKMKAVVKGLYDGFTGNIIPTKA